jgi:hypothetical protein
VRSSLRLPLPEKISATETELSARTYCPGAAGLNFEYYDATEEDWVEEWQDRTDLPGAVRVVLYALPETSEESAAPTLSDVMPFSTVVHLALGAQDLGTGQPETEESTTTPATTTPTGLSGIELPSLTGPRPATWVRPARSAGRTERL